MIHNRKWPGSAVSPTGPFPVAIDVPELLVSVLTPPRRFLSFPPPIPSCFGIESKITLVGSPPWPRCGVSLLGRASRTGLFLQDLFRDFSPRRESSFGGRKKREMGKEKELSTVLPMNRELLPRHVLPPSRGSPIFPRLTNPGVPWYILFRAQGTALRSARLPPTTFLNRIRTPLFRR